MKFWDYLFGSKAEPIKSQPQIKFGRYTDSYKDKTQYEAWETALNRFEATDYLASYRAFFNYLRDNREDNVRWVEENGGIKFEILQGSKRVTGFANAQKFTAEARIAKAENLSVAIMRRLVEANYALDYSRYGLDTENHLIIKFDSYALDGSPYKLYYALKEVAVNADKQDDLLLDEFSTMLKPIDMGSKMTISETEKEMKYQFLTTKIKTTLDEIDKGKLDAQTYPGGVSYLLLDTAYRVDYLTAPEGFLMETLERVHRTFFSAEQQTAIQKNTLIRKEFEKLLNRVKPLVLNELYATTASFGILLPKQHDTLQSLIDGELQNMDWYEKNKHEAVALAVTGYIVGLSLFSYALPKVDRELLAFYYRIFEPGYFEGLGYTPQYFDPIKRSFNQKAIKEAVHDMIKPEQIKYPKLSADFAILDFSTPMRFARTYLLMLKKLDFTEGG